MNYERYYKRYPWIVPGSIKKVDAGSIIDDLIVTHGCICKIKCQETGKIRIINLQDAFQVKYCREVQQRKKLERAKLRRHKNYQ